MHYFNTKLVTIYFDENCTDNKLRTVDFFIGLPSTMFFLVLSYRRGSLFFLPIAIKIDGKKMEGEKLPKNVLDINMTLRLSV